MTDLLSATVQHLPGPTSPGALRSLRHPLLSWLVLLSILGGGTIACSGDTTGPAPQTATQAYWSLQLTPHAVNLTLSPPYNTLQLTALPLNAVGTPLTGLGPATFRATDSTVTVGPTGLVTTHYVTAQTSVIASLTAQGVTLADTVFIQVTEVPPPSPLTIFSLKPLAGDSAKRAQDVISGTTWPVLAIDAAGDTVCDSTACALQVYYTSSNPQVATISRSGGFIFAQDTGHTVFTVTTLAYGRVLVDSVLFTVGYQLYPHVFMTVSLASGMPRFMFSTPKMLTLGVGAVVLFFNAPGPPNNVIFDNPEPIDTASVFVYGCCVLAPPTGSGNIPTFGGDTLNQFNNIVGRRFPTAGTYRYHSSVIPSDTSAFIIKEQQ